MSWLLSNKNADGSLRETSAETHRRIRTACRSLFRIDSSPNVIGTQQNGSDASLISIKAPDPVQAPAVTLPIKVTAEERATHSRFRAALLFERQRIDRERTTKRQLLGRQLARLRTLRFRKEQAHERLEKSESDRDTFVKNVPKPRQRFLNAPVARTMRSCLGALGRGHDDHRQSVGPLRAGGGPVRSGHQGVWRRSRCCLEPG